MPEIVEELEHIIRAKWLMDGADTLGKAANLLREEADRLESLERDGWELTETVLDDYGFIQKA